jgi:hypothetical protein
MIAGKKYDGICEWTFCTTHEQIKASQIQNKKFFEKNIKMLRFLQFWKLN